jgi:hypothetical protein
MVAHLFTGGGICFWALVNNIESSKKDPVNKKRCVKLLMMRALVKNFRYRSSQNQVIYVSTTHCVALVA